MVYSFFSSLPTCYTYSSKFIDEFLAKCLLYLGILRGMQKQIPSSLSSSRSLLLVFKIANRTKLNWIKYLATAAVTAVTVTTVASSSAEAELSAVAFFKRRAV